MKGRRKIMMERLFTTKMSANRKKLESRFQKIRTKNGKLSKWIGYALFGIILLAVVSVGIVIAVNRSEDYRMSDTRFSEYLNRPVGAIMAEIDYLDHEKLVFHYLDGFFVINLQPREVLHKIDLGALNIAGHTQGDCFTVFQADQRGNYVYLKNEGPRDRIGNYDNYIINLHTGDVSLGTMPQETELFSNFADTFTKVGNPYGFYSIRCVTEETKTHYLTVLESDFSSLQLVSVDHQAEDNSRFTYLFPRLYVSDANKRNEVIEKSLSDGEEITKNSGLDWEVNADTVRSLIHKISELRQMQYQQIPDGNYVVTIQNIEKNGEVYQKLFIINNYNTELILSEKLTDEDYYMGIINILNSPVSDLYHKTEEFLAQEFHRVHDPLYDIQHLTISNWEEHGNEATFWYKMTFLYYNRDPDKAAYIQEAKQRSQKEYEVLYEDYLALKEGNFQFKIIDNGTTLELYTNVAPQGTEWVPITVDDFVMSD